ncbi:MAG: sugar ABC transporter permease [Lachnospiraceae bacterium]|nr:sugar ABC transporter permease [Lachnospiraceae bacterium]
MKKQKSKLAGLQKRKAIAGYLFISPFIIGFLMFMVKPLLQSLSMCFCQVDLGPATFEQTYAGLKWFKHAFTVDADFVRMLTEVMTKMVINTFAVMVFSFFVALILNQKFHGRALVRAIFFLPVILSSGIVLGLEDNNSVVAQLAETIEQAASGVSVTGVIEEIFKTAGVGTRAFETVFEVIDGIYDVAIASGIQIIIFLSGLQTISASMYEAADIEGCTAWEALWKITFPMISSLFLVNWIYTIIDFSMRSDNQLISKIQVIMAGQLNYGLASAMSWVYFLVVMAFIAITSFLISKGVYYYE